MPTFYLIAIRFTLGSGVLALGMSEAVVSNSPRTIRWRGAMAGSSFSSLPMCYRQPACRRPQPHPKVLFSTAVYCVMVPFLAWAVAKVRPDRYHVVAAVLCVAGIGLVSLDEQLTLNFGDLLTLLSAFFCACNIVVLPLPSREKDVTLLTVCQFMFTGLYAWIGGALTETFPAQDLLNPDAYLPLLYLSILATAVALLFQNIGMVWRNPHLCRSSCCLWSRCLVCCSLSCSMGIRSTVRLVAGFGLTFLAIICLGDEVFLPEEEGKGQCDGCVIEQEIINSLRL